MSQVSMRCPSCRSEIPQEPGFSPWCDRCGWNTVPIDDRPAAKSTLEALLGNAAKRLERRRFDTIVRRRAAGARFNFATLLLVVLSGLVLLFTPLVAVAGVISLRSGAVLGVALGILLLGIAWVLRPRIQNIPQFLKREAEPDLFATCDEVARAVGAPRAQGII